ncbi:hypothetical protein Psch_04028 [Pelotomaculum schinkii]|uniref:Uncharacterized protein n=1 Tax=Pelotomaculum schinkii TaxID=78350 RepID=A0A4Y7R6E7_9FIRM|nr:hypothetical protein [Pelotomaculum schinkii]TEB04302.1 hypothetical protein Psch_04028 [Pelotomaculum schinkii]
MPKVRNHVRLSESERKTLLKIISKGTASAKSIMHANVLLAADENSESGKKSEAEIAELFHVHPRTVHTNGSSIQSTGFRLHSTERNARRLRLNPSLPEKWKQRLLRSAAALHHRGGPDGH